MQFNEIKKEMAEVNFETRRLDSNDYFEAVIVKDEFLKLTEKLEKFFGPPVWPSKNKLSTQIEEAINEFGGVRSDQTLYFWSQESDTIFAMLWPWADGSHITLKLAKK